MFGQVHHFVKYNKGKAPYAEERFFNEAHRLYGVLESRLAQHEYVADAYSIADLRSMLLPCCSMRLRRRPTARFAS